jgi:DNA-binding LacI/PurR family transcriptional regulator
MDHTPLSRLTTPPLTTLEYDTSLVAQQNVQAILRRLDKADDRNEDTEIRFQLIDGGTT